MTVPAPEPEHNTPRPGQRYRIRHRRKGDIVAVFVEEIEQDFETFWLVDIEGEGTRGGQRLIRPELVEEMVRDG